MSDKLCVSVDDLNIHKRKPGISGFIRARNEEDWLALAVESHIPFLDEIIIVHNRCTDRTPEISNDLANKYPDKVKVFHYTEDIYPQGSQKCASLPSNDVHSLVNYYNYALCKTTRTVAVKIDGDQVAIPVVFARMAMAARTKAYQKFYYTFRGINLWDKDGVVYVCKKDPFTVHDRGFFVVNRTTWHTLEKKRAIEIFHGGNHLSRKETMFGFYHTKGMKKDRGVGNYDLQDNPNSRYHGVVAKYWTSPELIPWEQFVVDNKLSYLPHPSVIGIKPVTR